MTVPQSPAQVIRKEAKDHNLTPEDVAVLCRNYSNGRVDTPEQLTGPELLDLHWDLPAFASSPARMERARRAITDDRGNPL